MACVGLKGQDEGLGIGPCGGLEGVLDAVGDMLGSGNVEPSSGSMKRKNESQLVTVEDFYRRCLQGTKPRLGRVASKRGSRLRSRRRRGVGIKRGTLWDRIRER